jgi:hypothetical protein
MKKFTRLVEQIESERYYKISTEVDLILKAENDGEAGYLADSELGSIENHSEFRIVNIEEITEEEYKSLRITEAISTEIGSHEVVNDEPKEPSASEQILIEWTTEFGNRTPSAIEKFEFYRKMREQKYDADVIMDTLKDKISPEWMKKQ